MDESKLIWKETGKSLLRNCRIFDLYQTVQQTSDGEEANFYLLDTPDWVSVIPVLYDNNDQCTFIMVKQYRFGIKQLTIEFPAGLVNPGENPEQAARRELMEETGNTSKSVKELLKLRTVPAFMNNWIHFFIAANPEQTSALALDQHEKLEVIMIPEKELEAKIGKGEFINSHTFIAYQLFKSQKHLYKQ